jgi:hypothetical protein
MAMRPAENSKSTEARPSGSVVAGRNSGGCGEHELVEALRVGGRADAWGEGLDDRHDRVGEGAVPVAVEHLRQLAHDRPRRDHVHVDEVGLGAAHEVLVGQVAAAGHREAVVGDEQLVVHPEVDAAELVRRRDDAAEGRPAARGQRVEQAHLDVGNRGEAAKQLVLAAGVEVVDEQADAHAAPRRVAQLAQELQADAVVGQLVVLGVERALGAPRQCQPGIEGEVAGRQEAKARFAGPGLLQAGGCEQAEVGAGGVAHRRARGPLRQRRQTGAAGEHCTQQEHERQQEAGVAVSAHAMSPPVRRGGVRGV